MKYSTSQIYARIRQSCFLSRLARLGLVTLAAVVVVTAGQPLVQSASSKSTKVQYIPPTPPDRGAPGNRGGAGGSRTVPCAAESQQVPLTALMPVYPLPRTESATFAATQVWAVTQAERPAAWFYVPYTRSTATAEFVIQDEADNDIYRAPVGLPNTPGIVSVRVPNQAPALEVGKLYHWFFKVQTKCGSTTIPYVEGWMQRVKLAPAIAQQIQQAPPLQRAALYAENGIWFDALTTLAELRQSLPQDQTLAENWISLLRSADLEAMATAPLVK
jgi:hypothetical protein